VITGENAMTRDYYAILGMRRSASMATIREAYLKLARETHPDLHPGDEAAQQRFCDIQAAFEVLGDGARRAEYDRQSRPQPVGPLSSMVVVRQVSYSRGSGHIRFFLYMRLATIAWIVVLIGSLLIVASSPEDIKALRAKGGYEEANRCEEDLPIIVLLPTGLYSFVMLALAIGVAVDGVRGDDRLTSNGRLVFSMLIVLGCVLFAIMFWFWIDPKGPGRAFRGYCPGLIRLMRPIAEGFDDRASRNRPEVGVPKSAIGEKGVLPPKRGTLTTKLVTERTPQCRMLPDCC
jgi:hypothetical protein